MVVPKEMSNVYNMTKYGERYSHTFNRPQSDSIEIREIIPPAPKDEKYIKIMDALMVGFIIICLALIYYNG